MPHPLGLLGSAACCAATAISGLLDSKRGEIAPACIDFEVAISPRDMGVAIFS
jgi:hypothetical protein